MCRMRQSEQALGQGQMGEAVQPQRIALLELDRYLVFLGNLERVLERRAPQCGSRQIRAREIRVIRDRPC